VAAPASFSAPTPTAAPPQQQRRAAPAPVPTSRRSPSVSQSDLAAPRASAPTPSQPASAPKRVARSAVALPAATAERSTAGSDLRGVPLGSLASCVSDREEDALKRKLIAAVTTQKECVSRAGTYRFVETKNLNSFLIWIDRAPSRAEADRCGELRLALECVAARGR